MSLEDKFNRVVNPIVRLEDTVINSFARSKITAKHPVPSLAVFPTLGATLPLAASYLFTGSTQMYEPWMSAAGAAIGSAFSAIHYPKIMPRVKAQEHSLPLELFDRLDKQAARSPIPTNKKGARKFLDNILSHPRTLAVFGAAAITSYFAQTKNLASQDVAALTTFGYVSSRYLFHQALQLFHSSSSEMVRKTSISLAKNKFNTKTEQFVNDLYQDALQNPNALTAHSLAELYARLDHTVESLLWTKKAIEEFEVPAAFNIAPGFLHIANIKDSLDDVFASNASSAQYVGVARALAAVGERSGAHAVYDRMPEENISQRIIKNALLERIDFVSEAQDNWKGITTDIVNNSQYTLLETAEGVHTSGKISLPNDSLVQDAVFAIKVPDTDVSLMYDRIGAASTILKSSKYFLPKVLGDSKKDDATIILYYLLEGKSLMQLSHDKEITSDHIDTVADYMHQLHLYMPYRVSSVGVVDMEQKYQDAIQHAFPTAASELIDGLSIIREMSSHADQHLDMHAQQGFFGRHFGAERYAPFDFEDKGLRNPAWDIAKLLTDPNMFPNAVLDISATYEHLTKPYNSPIVEKDSLLAGVLQPILWASTYSSRAIKKPISSALHRIPDMIELLKQDSMQNYAKMRPALQKIENGARIALETI